MSVDALLPLVPAFAKAARHELWVYQRITDELKSVAAFVVERATAARSSLSHNSPEDLEVEQSEEDWREVCDVSYAQGCISHGY